MQETLTNKDSTSAIELLDLSNNRSVVWTAKEQVEVQHRHVPELGDGDILVEVISTGICGSDVHVWSSNHENQPPVMGHESAGSIIRLGSKVTDRFIGQRVAIEPGFPCMKCEYCIRGKPNICANLSYCGHTKDGTLTRFHVAPQELTVPIPDTVSWEQAGCIQPLAIAVQLARRANMRAQQTVAILYVPSPPDKHFTMCLLTELKRLWTFGAADTGGSKSLWSQEDHCLRRRSNSHRLCA